MKKFVFGATLVFAAALIAFQLIPLCGKLDLNKLSSEDQKEIDSILSKTESALARMKDQGINPNWLELDGLKKGLSWKEKRLIENILHLKPSDLGAKTPAQPLDQMKTPYGLMDEVKNQPVTRDGKPLDFTPPLIDRDLHKAFEKMMAAMEKDLGKKFYIESGHRSQGYHLYNFLKYLREHHYSLIETGKLNALPGYSEHNLWYDHAIDLINAEGVNGEPRVEDYEKLPEHQWMIKHAGEYGFTLSYPKSNPFGIDFEPWHWRYTENSNEQETMASGKKNFSSAAAALKNN